MLPLETVVDNFKCLNAISMCVPITVPDRPVIADPRSGRWKSICISCQIILPEKCFVVLLCWGGNALLWCKTEAVIVLHVEGSLCQSCLVIVRLYFKINRLGKIKCTIA